MKEYSVIALALFFVVLGLLIKYAKWYFLIAGYNTMPKEEKENYDIDSIATVFRNAMWYIGAVLVLVHYLARWSGNLDIEDVAFFLAMIPGVLYLLAKTNSDRYKIKK